MSKVQEANSILRIGFALLKCPHLHRAYLVTVRFDLILAAYDFNRVGLHVIGYEILFTPIISDSFI